ncbi:MAG TPA: ASCH domain-containing protein [Pirellulales bacterium]
MLLFKKKFLAAIARGEKTQTIRLWKYRKMRAGQRSYIPGVGYIAILSVDEVALADLNDADAQLDGFETADALRSEIQTLYGDALAAGNLTFRVRFRVLDPREQAAAVAERESRRSPSSG